MARLEKMTDAAIERVYNKYSRIKHTQDSSDLKASDKKQDCISERQRVLLEVNEGVVETSWIGCLLCPQWVRVWGRRMWILFL